MTSLRRAQVPTKFGKSRYCLQHPEKHIIMSCDNCNGELVCAKCVTTLHKGHSLSDLEEYAAKKIQSAQQKLASLRTISEQLAGIRNHVTTMAKQNNMISKTTISEIRKRRNELKEIIDKIANAQEHVCKKKEKENTEELNAKENEILEIHREIQLCIEKFKEACESESGWSIIDLDIEQNNVWLPNDFSLQPLNIQLYELVWSQHDSHQSGLDSVFGDLKLHEISSDINENGLPTDEKSDVTTDVSFVEMSQFKLSKEVIASLCPVSGDEVWVRQWKDNVSPEDITLVSREGQVLVNVKLDYEIKAIAPSSDGSILACCGSKRVMLIQQDGGSREIFNTEPSPTGIDVMKNGDVVVCLRSRGTIIKYSEKGELLLSKSAKDFNEIAGMKPMKNPHRICVYRKTGNLTIVDKGPPQRLLVMDEDFDLKYMFNGSTTLKPNIDYYASDLDGNSKFVVNDACFDRYGNVIYTAFDDSQMGYIAMLSPEGKSLGTLTKFSGSRVPMAIACDSQGTIWFGDNEGTVVVAKCQGETCTV